jgi:hypothetical protein
MLRGVGRSNEASASEPERGSAGPSCMSELREWALLGFSTRIGAENVRTDL